jgi:hypothetical protein
MFLSLALQGNCHVLSEILLVKLTNLLSAERKSCKLMINVSTIFM